MAYGTRIGRTGTQARQHIRFCSGKLEEIVEEAEGGTWSGEWIEDGSLVHYHLLCEDGETRLQVSARTWSELAAIVGSMLDAAMIGIDAVKAADDRLSCLAAKFGITG